MTINPSPNKLTPTSPSNLASNTGVWTRGQTVVLFEQWSWTLANSPGITGTDALSPPVLVTNVTADVVQDSDHVWDLVGNLNSVRDTAGATDQYQCFTYDNLDRLQAGWTWANGSCGAGNWVVGPDPYAVDYSYDQIGNITSASGTGTVGGTYAYVGAGPHAVTTAGGNTYGYDNAGNMTARTTGGGTQVLSYDIKNRLQTITELLSRVVD